jgi:glucosamine--fructose-6-phosphate aminotransferase (isomerizing)
VDRIVVAGLGSSYTAAQMAAPLLRRFSAIPVFVLPATDLALFGSRIVNARSLVILVSRSGERGWIHAAREAASACGARCVAVTGVRNSALARSADAVLVTGEGPESAFPKTKSVLAASGLLMRLGLALAAPEDGEVDALVAQLRQTPEAVARTIASTEPTLQAMTPWIATHEHVLIAGAGSNYGVALEGAIKIQEAAYVPAQGDDTGNVLHGALGALDERWLYVGLMTGADAGLSAAALRVVGDFRAHLLAIADPGIEVVDAADRGVRVAAPIDWLLAGLEFLPTVQILAFHWALARGMNPDRPAFADIMLRAMLPAGRNEPDWQG